MFDGAVEGSTFPRSINIFSKVISVAHLVLLTGNGLKWLKSGLHFLQQV